MEKQFYTCRYDAAFKEVFMKEENKDLLICLLEKILNLKIKEIKYLNLERNVLNVHVKRKHFDLFLDTDIGKIQVEINSYYSDYIPVRNTSYICNTYTSYTSRGDMYDPNINIIQINFSYGLKKDKLFSKYYIQDEDGNKYVSNFLIIELNMDKYMEFWYNKDEKKINEYIEYKKFTCQCHTLNNLLFIETKQLSKKESQRNQKSNQIRNTQKSKMRNRIRYC